MSTSPPPSVAIDAADPLRPPVPFESPPRPHLLSIDWKAVEIHGDADALALWNRIAPTGDDWEGKLDEIPGNQPVAHQLALAMLHAGNFTCVPPGPKSCAAVPLDVPEPSTAATLADPCLRRVLALWSLDQLDADELPKVRDAMRAIASIPPPESQLVATVLKLLPESDHDGRYELLAIAWQAGQRDLVNGSLGTLDVPHLSNAVTKLHVDGALEVLSAEAHRPIYLEAIADEKLPAAARAQAIRELAAAGDQLAPDLAKALVALTKTADCAVAAVAARTLELHGNAAFVPKRPKVTAPEALQRGLCVLASYEPLLRADEASPLLSYLPARGLELVRVVYDPFNEVDADGDGDPHVVRTTELIARDAVAIPEADDLIVALRHCTRTACASDEHEFRFTFRAGTLARLDVIDRPPCKH